MDIQNSNAHAYNCLAYYMGTSQDAAGNVNGGTKFYSWTNGDRFYARDAAINGVSSLDGMYGMDEYFRSCGYGTGDIRTDTNSFSQRIYNSATAPNGFTFAAYKAEIDLGGVMMIQAGYGPLDVWLRIRRRQHRAIYLISRHLEH